MTTKIKIIIGLVLVAVLLFLLKAPIFILTTFETKEITVEKTYIKKYKKQDVFFVETKDGETFKNVDVLWTWKWDSKDIDTALKEDSTYTINVYGIRNNFWDTYRNISSIE
jgi:hypothetical protein